MRLSGLKLFLIDDHLHFRLIAAVPQHFHQPSLIASNMVAGKQSPSAVARASAAASTKLPPLPKLRIRRPDRVEANPCLGVMSSMLGASITIPQHTEDVGECYWDVQFTDNCFYRLLGISRTSSASLCCIRTTITSLYGRQGMLISFRHCKNMIP